MGRNYRGLKKLYNIEINDALNVSSLFIYFEWMKKHMLTFIDSFQQSKYNIEEYRREKAWALYPYTMKKFPPPKNNTSN